MFLLYSVLDMLSFCLQVVDSASEAESNAGDTLNAVTGTLTALDRVLSLLGKQLAKSIHTGF